MQQKEHFSSTFLLFLLNKFDVLTCKFKVYSCYFVTFIYCNMIANVAIFITLHNVRNLGSFGSVLPKCVSEPKQKYSAESLNRKKSNQ